MHIIDIVNNVVEKSDMWSVNVKDYWVTLFKICVDDCIFR